VLGTKKKQGEINTFLSERQDKGKLIEKARLTGLAGSWEYSDNAIFAK